MSPLSQSNPEPGVEPAKGLVYHTGGLGDFVLSLSAVFRVVQAHPGLRWSFWGPRERLALLPGFGVAPPGLLRSGHTLWGDSPVPDAAAALGRFRVVLAFGGRDIPSWAAVPGPRVLRVAGFPPEGGCWVPVHQGRQLTAQGVSPLRASWLPSWRREVLPRGEPSELLLHPGSGDPRKNLPGPAWEEVLGALRRRMGLPVTLVLGPAERERGGWEALGRAAGCVRCCADLGELLAALSRARLFLGNDSGVTHLAAALGIPVVAAFGPSDPALWRPLGARVRVVRAARDCAPCSAGGPIGCPEPGCWEPPPVGAVVAAAGELLPAPFAKPAPAG